MKKNLVTELLDGFFEFISTGYATADKYIRRAVSVAVLLAVVIATVSSLGTSVYVGTQVVSGAATLTTDAYRSVVTVEEEDAVIISAQQSLQDVVDGAVSLVMPAEKEVDSGPEVPLATDIPATDK